MNRAVFLDRDGVLNRVVYHDGRPGSPRDMSELEIASDAPDSLNRLQAAGFVLLCVTNQPELRRGSLRPEALEAMHQALLSRLPLRDILVCGHDDADGCACRKPQPGLLLAAAARYELDLSASFMVGDRRRDVEAGRRAGCRTVFVYSGHEELTADVAPGAAVNSLAQAADWILAQPPARC